MDVNGTKKLIYQLANSYRKGHKQKPFNIKAQGNDEVLTEPHEIKECWTNYFSSLLNVQQHQELTTMSEPTAVVGHQLITEHEVESAVKRSKSGKAPGCDIIPNEVYKAGEHEMVRRLTAIFNQAYREGCVVIVYRLSGGKQRYVRSISKMVTTSDARTTEGSPL